MSIVNKVEWDIYYEDNGKGVPLLLLEGLGYSLWMWNRQIPYLAKKIRCVTPDNRGVGRSTPLDSPYTIQGFAEDAISVLDSLGLSQSYLLGVSMGGFIAQEMARIALNRVKGLIIVSSSCGGKESLPMTKESYGEMVKVVEGESQKDRLTRSMSVAFTRDFPNRRKGEFDEIIESRLDWIQDGNQFMYQVLATSTFDSCSSNGSLKIPTLIVAGTEDMVLPWTNSLVLHKSFNNSSLVLFKNQNHLLFIEEYERFNELVLGFIESVENGTFVQTIREVI